MAQTPNIQALLSDGKQPEKRSLEAFLADWAASNLCQRAAKDAGESDRPFVFCRQQIASLGPILRKAGYVKV